MNPLRPERGSRPLVRVFGALLISASAITPLSAQTHKVVAPENVVRAVGVYEWTGDMAKPTASRLIPVSLFIDGKLEDAAVYLARPVPFALDSGNVYELDQAGIALGTLDLVFARHLVAVETATTVYDDGWFGYGKFVPPAPPVVSTLKPAKKFAAINGFDDEDDRPHFSARSATPGSGGAATPIAGAPSTTASDTPADDPDRPTLRRRSPQEAKNAPVDQPSGSDDDPALNDDPNRPLLHRGKPVNALTEAEIPKLTGLPDDQDLHQLVAVSDATNRPPHDFSRVWDDDAEHQAILAEMQSAARAQIAAYEAANAIAPSNTSMPIANAPAAIASPETRPPNSKLRHAATPTPPQPPPPEPLLDEQLKGYTLSYGGAPTYVYTAHTGDLDPTLCYVTLVAQVNMQGEPEMAITSVTDATHLDRTPRMKLVDAVDAEASNRASLLFELRAQNSRQFALYRVIGARARQTFLTGSTQ